MISSFVSQANKLRNVQMYLEHSLKSCGVSFDDENSINDFRERLSTDRFKECQDFRLSILNIAEPLNSLKFEVFNAKSLDLKQLKADLINIQERSRMAKAEAATKMRLLSEQENELTEEVFCLQQRMCEWRKNGIEVHKPKKKMPVKEASAKEPSKEVQTFTKFLQKSGGHENGWRVKDHSVFLKLRKKYSERVKMIAAVRSIFPDMSERDVEKHEQWYLQYSKLQSEQNDSIERWREEQNNSRSEKNDVVVISEKMRKAAIEDPRDVKERLRSWKEEKRRQLEQQQQLNRDLDERMRQMENSRKVKYEEAKLEIAKWKREKELQENRVAQQKLLVKLRKEEYLRLMDGKCSIKQFQCQDEVFLRRRLALREAKEAVGKTSCERKVSTAAMHRNPERLLQPTKQWLSRFSKTADAQYDQDKFWKVTEKTCKLGIPEWRKQMRIQ